MSVDEDTLRKMEIYGGSFVQQLSLLYRMADQNNKKRLEECFSDYFEEYKNFPRRK